MHFTFCLITILFAIGKIRNGSKSLSSFVLLGFSLIVSLGCTFAPYLPLSNIDYLNNPTFIINFKNPDLYLLQVSAHWIFFIIMIVFITLHSNIAQNWQNPLSLSTRFRPYIGIAFFAIATAAYYRYFILGPGLGLLLESRFSFSNAQEAIAHRLEIRYYIETGQGGYLANISSKLLFPVCATIFLLSRDRFRYPILIICFLSSMAFAIQTREKSPIVAIAVTYLALFIINRIGRTNLSHIKNISIGAVACIVLFFSFGIASYMINFGLSFYSSIQSIFARVLAIPGATETNFFAVFPNFESFRGIDNIFKIPLLPNNGGDISIYEVALIATGNAFATNASFLSVAWSGAGFGGVVTISVILGILLIFIDFLLSKLTNEIFFYCCALSFSAFIGLTSGSFLDYVSWGGITAPILLIGSLMLTNTLKEKSW